MMAVLPCVHPAEEVPPNFLRAQHMVGALQDYRLKDEEPFGIPAALSDSRHLNG